MSKPKALILDYDDCCVPFIQQITYYYNRLTGHNLKASDWRKYDLRGTSIIDDRGNKVNFDQVFSLFSSLDYTTIPLIPGAYRFVTEFENLGVEIFVVTARDQSLRGQTIKNIKFNRLPIKSQNVYCSKNKAETIKKIQENYEVIGFVDDSAKNIKLVASELDIPVYMVEVKHNLREKVPEKVFIGSLVEIHGKILNNLNNILSINRLEDK